MAHIWFDMDGTLADLYGQQDWLKMLEENNPAVYRNAKPMPMLDIERFRAQLRNVKSQGHTVGVITWGAKVRENSPKDWYDKIAEAKLSWLKEYVPELAEENFNFQQYGVPKYNATKNKSGLQILIDDDKRVREQWIASGGVAYSPIQENLEKQKFSIINDILDDQHLIDDPVLVEMKNYKNSNPKQILSAAENVYPVSLSDLSVIRDKRGKPLTEKQTQLAIEKHEAKKRVKTLAQEVEVSQKMANGAKLYESVIDDLHMSARSIAPNLSDVYRTVTSDMPLSPVDAIESNVYMNTYDSFIASNIFMGTETGKKKTVRRILPKDLFEKNQFLVDQFGDYQTYELFHTVTAGYGRAKLSLNVSTEEAKLTKSIMARLDQVLHNPNLKDSIKASLEQTCRSAQNLRHYISTNVLHLNGFDVNDATSSAFNYYAGLYKSLTGKDVAPSIKLDDLETNVSSLVNQNVAAAQSIVEQHRAGIQSLYSTGNEAYAATYKELHDRFATRKHNPLTGGERNKLLGITTVDEYAYYDEKLRPLLSQVAEHRHHAQSLETAIRKTKTEIADQTAEFGQQKIVTEIEEQITRDLNTELTQLEAMRTKSLGFLNSNPELSVPLHGSDPLLGKRTKFITKRTKAINRHVDTAIETAKKRADAHISELRKAYASSSGTDSAGLLADLEKRVKLTQELEEAIEAYSHEVKHFKTGSLGGSRFDKLQRIHKLMGEYNQLSPIPPQMLSEWSNGIIKDFNKYGLVLDTRNQVAKAASEIVSDIIDRADTPADLIHSAEYLRSMTLDKMIDNYDGVIKELGLTKDQAAATFRDIERMCQSAADHVEMLSNLSLQQDFLVTAQQLVDPESSKNLHKLSKRYQHRVNVKAQAQFKRHKINEAEKAKQALDALIQDPNISDAEKEIAKIAHEAAKKEVPTEITSAIDSSIKEQSRVIGALDKEALRLTLKAAREQNLSDFYERTTLRSFADRNLTHNEFLVRHTLDGRSIGRISFSEGGGYGITFRNQSDEVINVLTTARKSAVTSFAEEPLGIPQTFELGERVSERIRTLAKMHFSRNVANHSILFQQIGMGAYRPGFFRSLRYIMSAKRREAVSQEIANSYAAYMKNRLFDTFNANIGRDNVFSEMVDQDFAKAMARGDLSKISFDEVVDEVSGEKSVVQKIISIDTDEKYQARLKTLVDSAGKTVPASAKEIEQSLKQLVHLRSTLAGIETEQASSAISAITNSVGEFAGGNYASFKISSENAIRAAEKAAKVEAYAGRLKASVSTGLMGTHISKVSSFIITPLASLGGLGGMIVGGLSAFSTAATATSTFLNKQRRLEFGEGAALTTQAVATDRQYAEKRIQNSKYSARTLLGREAQLLGY